MQFERELLKGVAPVVVLEILSRGKMYGYELSDALSHRSSGILSLGRGTLYPLLYNLEAKGLVAAEWEENEHARKRRYYSITSSGKAELAAKREQWMALQQGVNLVFGIGFLNLAGIS
ncbi:MAG: helix-turn-helix transcriptional regulator [Planctomycetales bacterium]|nr:helix-turn-helix transcriptional regulator [Planctomycetales bacterium]